MNFMAELTIHKHDGKTDTKGLAMLIRDITNCDIREAKKIIQHCKDGGRATIQVPFAQRLAVAAKFHEKGFTTS
jgi:hypothetical protein